MIRKQHQLDMLGGSLFGNLVRYAVPLILTNVLQLLYNAADMIVVGQFAPNGDVGLAAIGAIAPVSAILLNIGTGLSVGISVMVARYIGADDRRSTFETVHTGMCVGLVVGAVLAIVGSLLADPLLHLMGTPSEIMDKSILYMRIRMVGQLVALPFSFIAAIFRAAGNTVRPLLILSITGLLNVVMNLVFVLGWGMGVEGVAYATLVAEIVSFIMGFWSLMRTDGLHKLYWREIRIYIDKLVEILKIGVPSMLQSIVYNISNIFVQASLNTFPAHVGSGNVAAANLEGFISVAMGSIQQANMTFTSQNIGARQYRRIGPINRTCSLLVIIIGSFSVLLYLFGPTLLRLYNTNPDVIAAGMRRLLWNGCFYFLYGLSEVQAGSLRGMGYSLLPAAFSCAGSVGVQLMWILLAFGNCPASMDPLDKLSTLYMCYPASFLFNVIALSVVFFICNRKLQRHAAKHSDEDVATT